MRELHVLGVTEDGETLLLALSADAPRPSHSLVLDDHLQAVVRGLVAAPGVERQEIALSPKEIQARLRAGESAEKVAKAAEVSVARVLRYAAPVEAERERIVDEARDGFLHRNRGPDGRTRMGEIVESRLLDTAGLKPESVQWSARRRHDGAWVVSLAYVARGGRRSAQWLWRPATKELTAADAAASRLSAEAPLPKPRVRSRPKPQKAFAVKKAPRAVKKAAAKKAAAVQKAATKKPAPSATKPAARKAATKKPAPSATKAARKAATKKPALPATKAAATRAPAVRKKANAAKAATKRVRVAEATPLRAVPAVPRNGGRVPVPSWSDVLLGVAPSSDK